MDIVMLSRLQFAVATLFHFLFVPLSMGLPILIAIQETQYVRTGNVDYKKHAQFWGRLLIINFVIGVVTGITLEFQFGTNWARYSQYVGDIFGPLLAIEAATSFFLESTFMAVWAFGWNKVSPRVHALAIWLAVKTDRPMFDRAVNWAHKFWWAELFVLTGFLAASIFATRLYANYLRFPLLLIMPVLIVAALVSVKIFLHQKSAWKAFFASGSLIILVTMAALTGLFPNLVISTLNSAANLTVYNASSSDLTLKIMLVVVMIFVPIILAYQTWANLIFKNKVQPGEYYD